MSMRMVSVAITMWAIAAGNALAQSRDAGTAPAAPDAAAAGAVVQPAPGGGDMVILGAESRYVTRAWRDSTGHVYGACTREPAGADGKPTTREQP